MSNPSTATLQGDIAATVIHGAAVLVCLLAAILVFVLKLYKRFVYRLSLYQVLASLAFATVEMLQIIFIHYNQDEKVYSRLCTAIGFFDLYARWVKLLFTMWLVLHLFCFGACHKDLKKFEVWYVMTSLAVPIVFALVPLTTSTYQISPFHHYCYIYNINGSRSVELAERLILWDLPAIVLLIAASIAMVVILVIIIRALCRILHYEIMFDGDHFWRAFKELLPLTAFPIVFFIFILPQLVFHIKSTISPPPGDALTISTVQFTALWSMASGVSLLAHLSVTRCFSKKVVNSELKETNPLTELSAQQSES